MHCSAGFVCFVSVRTLRGSYLHYEIVLGSLDSAKAKMIPPKDHQHSLGSLPRLNADLNGLHLLLSIKIL